MKNRCAETYKACQTSKMKLFGELVNGFLAVNYFGKQTILDVWQGSEHAPGYLIFFLPLDVINEIGVK